MYIAWLGCKSNAGRLGLHFMANGLATLLLSSPALSTCVALCCVLTS
jgi:hypothetical protein